MASRVVNDSSTLAAMQLEAILASLGRVTSRVQIQRSMRPETSLLSPTDGWLLRHLAENGPVRLSTLAAWQGVDRSTITDQIRRLENRGLVERSNDPTDGRAYLIQLTSDGRDELGATVRAASAVCARILEGWTDEERTQLTTSMGRLVVGLERVVQASEA